MEVKKKKMCKSNGITLVSLVIMVAILMLVTSTMAMSINSRYQSQNLDKLSSDLKLLKDKVLLYYTENGQYPIIGDILQESGQEYELDLSKLSGLTLNYGSGKDNEDDIYIIDTSNGVIYYKKGIQYEGKTIHSLASDSQIDDITTIQVLKINNQIIEIQDENGITEDTIEVTMSTKSIVLKTGKKAVFKIETNLTDNVSYQWYKNEEKISGKTKNTYEISNIENGSNYYCEIKYDGITKKTEKVTIFLED